MTANGKTEQGAWHTTSACQGVNQANLWAGSCFASSKGSCPAPVDGHSLPPELVADTTAKSMSEHEGSLHTTAVQ